MVGFSSSSYFSKCFLKQFGVLRKILPDKGEIVLLLGIKL